jgi:hypothetical protein
VLVTSNRTALIEMVPNAPSIHAIKAKSPPGTSLREHFAAKHIPVRASLLRLLGRCARWAGWTCSGRWAPFCQKSAVQCWVATHSCLLRLLGRQLGCLLLATSLGGSAGTAAPCRCLLTEWRWQLFCENF